MYPTALLEPSTLMCRSREGSRAGWISQARWTTASAPRKSRTRSECATSAVAHSVFGKSSCGRRRETPTTDSIAESPATAWRRLVPTFPLAPVTTMRTSRRCLCSVPPKLRGPAGERHRHRVLLAVARVRDRDVVARPVRADCGAELVRGRDLRAAERDDDVAGLEAR